MPSLSTIISSNKQTGRSGCSRSLLARKAREKQKLLELGNGVEAYFPQNDGQ